MSNSRAAFLDSQIATLEQKKLDAAADGYQALITLEELDEEHQKRRKVLLGKHYEARQRIVEINSALQPLRVERATIEIPSVNGFSNGLLKTTEEEP